MEVPLWESQRDRRSLAMMRIHWLPQADSREPLSP